MKAHTLRILWTFDTVKKPITEAAIKTLAVRKNSFGRFKRTTRTFIIYAVVSEGWLTFTIWKYSSAKINRIGEKKHYEKKKTIFCQVLRKYYLSVGHAAQRLCSSM